MTDPNDEVEIEIDPETDRNHDTGRKPETERDPDTGRVDDPTSGVGAELGDIEADSTERSRAEGRRPRGSGFESGDGRGLEDELGRIDLLSTSEGYVEGRVTDLESIDETTVRLSVRLPHDVTVDFDLEKPIPWSREFLLARIVEDVGYDAASVGHLVGEPVYVTRSDLEDDDEGPTWWTWTLEDASRYLESTLARRFGFDADRGPEWRLVDPLERPAPEPKGGWRSVLANPSLVAAVVLLGAVAAVVGAFAGATGTVALSSAALLYALPGLALVALALVALLFAD